MQSRSPDPSSPWPRNLDEMRACPANIVFSPDLKRLRIIRCDEDAKKLPPPLRVPASKKGGWECRTVLLAIGAGLGLTEGADVLPTVQLAKDATEQRT
jgi:hypothetical protein